MRCRFIVIATLIQLLVSFAAYPQCSDLPAPTPDQEKAGLVGLSGPGSKSANPVQYQWALAELKNGTRFRVALENDASSAFMKPNDLAVFSVYENVYVDIDKTDNGVRFRKRCVAIPAGTEVFGVVNDTKGSYPFYIGGKSKLWINVRSIVLPGGTEIAINFAEPLPKYRNELPMKNVLRPCRSRGEVSEKRKKDHTKFVEKCIAGRRQKPQIPSSVVAVGAGTGLTLVKDDAAKQ